MSGERFQVVLKLANIHQDDRVWFGRLWSAMCLAFYSSS